MATTAAQRRQRELAQVRRATDDARRRWERYFQQRLMELFREELAAVIQLVREEYERTKHHPTIERKAFESKQWGSLLTAAAGLAIDQFQISLLDIFGKIAEAAGGAVINASSSPIQDFLANDPRVTARIEEATNRLVGIHEADYERLQQALIETARPGTATIDDFINTVQTELNVDEARAATIARTETGRALNGAGLDGARQSGTITNKQWNTQGDDNVRPEHADMEGETVPIDSTFSNGDDYPGESDFNCRCDISYSEDRTIEMVDWSESLPPE